MIHQLSTPPLSRRITNPIKNGTYVSNKQETLTELPNHDMVTNSKKYIQYYQCQKMKKCFSGIRYFDRFSNEEFLPQTTTSWPSGLRRDVKAVVFIGAGSNPADVKISFLSLLFGARRLPQSY